MTISGSAGDSAPSPLASKYLLFEPEAVGAVIWQPIGLKLPELMALMATRASAGLTAPSSSRSLQASGFCHGLPLSRISVFEQLVSQEST